MTSMSFHPTGDFILVGTEHPTSELLPDNFTLPENHTLKSTAFFSTIRFVVWDKTASKTQSQSSSYVACQMVPWGDRYLWDRGVIEGASPG